MIVIVISVVTLVPFTMAGVRSINKSAAGKPEGYDLPNISDFYITVISAIILAVIRKVCDHVCYPLVVSVCKE